MRYLLLVSMVALGCSHRTVLSTDSDCIGITLNEAIVVLGLKLADDPVLDDPPGDARALKGIDAEGHDVWLYFDRDPANVSVNRVWSIEVLRSRRVAGIARQTAAGWECVGDVIWLYHP
ncbi:MAG TPA: hypothetical protein VFC90_10145 [Planctomycetota bacterium]|nr:hypothetical protein [Planctomycetota bacterium]